MLPDDGEFLTLYFVYCGLFVILLTGFIISKKYKRTFRNNLLFFSAYTFIMICLFANKSNFEYGSSLIVLFYGAVFILLHLAIILFYGLYLLIIKRKKKLTV